MARERRVGRVFSVKRRRERRDVLSMMMRIAGTGAGRWERRGSVRLQGELGGLVGFYGSDGEVGRGLREGSGLARGGRDGADENHGYEGEDYCRETSGCAGGG